MPLPESIDKETWMSLSKAFQILAEDYDKYKGDPSKTKQICERSVLDLSTQLGYCYDSKPGHSDTALVALMKSKKLDLANHLISGCFDPNYKETRAVSLDAFNKNIFSENTDIKSGSVPEVL